MNLPTFAARTAWMGWWNLMRRYHDFEVRGEEILTRHGSGLIVGHHGRPGARSLCMLQAHLLAIHGQPTYAIAHDVMFKVPFISRVAKGMEMVPRTPAAIDEVVRAGHKLVVAPGGLEEAWGGPASRYRVSWGERSGYLKLALRHRLLIFPVAATGDHDAFVSLFDAYTFWRRLGLPEGLGMTVALGPLGMWPLTPPFPVRIVLYVGAPIDPARRWPGLHVEDRDGLRAAHVEVAATVQALLDRGRDETRGRAAVELPPLRWVDQGQARKA